jgi:hypothetical protein
VEGGIRGGAEGLFEEGEEDGDDDAGLEGFAEADEEDWRFESVYFLRRVIGGCNGRGNDGLVDFTWDCEDVWSHCVSYSCRFVIFATPVHIDVLL